MPTVAPQNPAHRMPVAGRTVLGLLLLLLTAASAPAHELGLTETLLLLRSDGTFQAEVACDLDALALGASPSADSEALAAALAGLAPAELEAKLHELRTLLRRRIRVRFDGEPADFRVELPERSERPVEQGGAPSLLGLKVRLAGSIPPGAREVTFFASRAFPPIHLTILDETALAGRRELVERGAESTPWPLGGAEEASLTDPLQTARTYFSLGVEHIVPRGVDHILFVLGLFLLGGGPRELLWKVTAFTVAHTLTLGLATLGVLSVSPAVVEPLIALSIAWVGFENLASTDTGRRRRRAGVFAFGLLHGLGFAGVLTALGLPRGETVLALGAFNLGVEAGQLLVLVAAAAVLAPWSRRAWYRRRIAVPLSLAVALAGLVWAVERTLG